jgi:hypothetical protein
MNDRLIALGGVLALALGTGLITTVFVSGFAALSVANFMLFSMICAISWLRP